MRYTFKEYIYRPIGAIKTLCISLKRKRDSIERPRIFLLNIPSHGNLGDHLISLAEQEFLGDYCSGYQVVLISSAALFSSVRFTLFDVREKDIICITGGGFLGSLYDDEKRIIKIVNNFPNNKIVFFPQSIYYAPTKEGIHKLNEAAFVFSKHQNLFIAARDLNTYRLLSNVFKLHRRQFSLMPDIALYMRFSFSEERHGALWCVRGDGESSETNKEIFQSIRRALLDRSIAQRNTDTYVNRAISIEMEKSEVMDKLKEFASAHLVITDRLHGMIYSVLTNTPAIVLDNITNKVSQVYDLWLKKVSFIRFIENDNGIEQLIDGLITKEYRAFENDYIRERLEPLIKAING